MQMYLGYSPKLRANFSLEIPLRAGTAPFSLELGLPILFYYYFIFYKFIKNLFYLFLFLAACGLSLVASPIEWGLLFVAMCGLLIAVASCCGVRALGVQASVVVARGVSSCRSRALERRLSSCGAQA